MPCIKTKEWLESVSEEKGFTAEEVVEMIKIFKDDNLGSVTFWRGIYDKYKPMNVSYSSDEIIEDLKADIYMDGVNSRCSVYYYEKEDCIILYDYTTPDFVAEEGLCDDLKDKSVIEMTLGEALEYFEFQDSLF